MFAVSVLVPVVLVSSAIASDVEMGSSADANLVPESEIGRSCVEVTGCVLAESDSRFAEIMWAWTRL